MATSLIAATAQAFGAPLDHPRLGFSGGLAGVAPGLPKVAGAEPPYDPGDVLAGEAWRVAPGRNSFRLMAPGRLQDVCSALPMPPRIDHPSSCRRPIQEKADPD